MARRKEAHGGGHGWFVTFADLMGLLVSFFVMLVAFSNQDAKKVQAVAGSMRDAFGVQTVARYSGVVESDSSPQRPKIKNAAHIKPQDSSVTPTPDEKGDSASRDVKFALAAASLRNALQSMPDLLEASKHIMFEETKSGFDIDVVDQDGASMFGEGSVDSVTPTPDEKSDSASRDVKFALAAASLRNALQTMPDLLEASKHIMFEETKRGFDIDVVDQDGASMFGRARSSRTSARKNFSSGSAFS